MTSLGACFFMRRDRFWELGGLDEAYGSWGSLGIEVACKSWLSGGRHVVNRKTWFAHFFRVGGIGFPYEIHGSDQEKARQYARQIWFTNGWPGQVLPLRWLVDKFWPIQGWSEAAKDALPAALSSSVSLTPNALTGDTDTLAGAFNEAADVPTPACVQAHSPSVLSMRDEFQVHRIDAAPNLAQVVDLDVGIVRDGPDQPRVGHAVDEQTPVSENGLPVSGMIEPTAPQPASGLVEVDITEQSFESRERDVRYCEGSHDSASYAGTGLGSASCVQHVVGPSILHRRVSAGVIYYSDCLPDPAILGACRRTIEQSGLPIVAVTLQPVDWPVALNVVYPSERGTITMFRQILIGLTLLDADVVFFAEHDLLYSPSHWTFRPPSEDRYWFNLNVWKVDVETGMAVTYETKQTSGLCANRQLLIRHYRERIRRVEAEGFSRRMGFEPGSHRRKERVDDVPSDVWHSSVPNLDLRHRHNLTASRWSPSEFRDPKSCQGWQEADTIPGWGRARDVVERLALLDQRERDTLQAV